MDSQVSALIIASPCQLRNGLQVLLAAIPTINRVSQVDDVASALAMGADHSPALVLLDSDLSDQELVSALRKLKGKWPEMKFIVLVDDDRDHGAAKAAGADVILTQGVLASKFYATVEALLSTGNNLA